MRYFEPLGMHFVSKGEFYVSLITIQKAKMYYVYDITDILCLNFAKSLFDFENMIMRELSQFLFSNYITGHTYICKFQDYIQFQVFAMYE